MKFKLLALATAATLVLTACGEDQQEQEEASVEDGATEETLVLDNLDKQISYIVGSNMARQFARDLIDLDTDALTKAIEDVKAGEEPMLSEEEQQQILASLQSEIPARLSKANQEVGEAYLAENATKEGVVVTESGLQYKEVVAGDGPIPTAEDTVVVHYRGTLVDGTVFDSSYDRNQPATFPVNAVIPGWIEALQLMNVGDKFELVIPPDIAYGESAPASIGPNSTLLFDVELLEIVTVQEPGIAELEEVVEEALDNAEESLEAVTDSVTEAVQ